MPFRAIRRLAVASAVASVMAGCSPAVDLSKGLEVTDVLTGFYDDGVKQKDLGDGRGLVPANVLRPSMTFRLKNVTDRELTSIQLMGSFWKAGEDGEWSSVNVYAVSTEGLPPGGSTAPITVKSDTAFNVEGARASLFSDHRFVDITLRLFAKRGGGLYRLGEYKIDRVILPTAGRGAARP